jgi:hypothetical protein
LPPKILPPLKEEGETRTNVSKSVIIVGNKEIGAAGAGGTKEEAKIVTDTAKKPNQTSEGEVKIESNSTAKTTINTNDLTAVKSTVPPAEIIENKTTEPAKITNNEPPKVATTNQ